MALEAGTKLGPYEILSPIGAGGMGEVYLATDSNLDRQVAIKVLPETMTRDKERVARFEREAKLLASLNHPNIAAIYGFDEADGSRFLVMEYVEGQTLGSHLDNGTVAIEDALDIAKQIAEALEAAHGQGVIHRDLKPANVMIRPDGAVKVLDFGLAKAMSDEASEQEQANSPTITANYSHPGVVLGTAAYMSPEQARGRPLDKRTDIWSLGIILFECLTGDRLFQGETANDSMGAILHKDPDWSLLPPGTPPTIQLLLRRCLSKDRKRRLHDIADARIELENAIVDPSNTSLGLAQAAIDIKRNQIPSARNVVALLLLVAVVALGTWALKPGTTMEDPVIRSTLMLFEDSSPVLNRPMFVLSRDGTTIVYKDKSTKGKGFFLRRLNQLGSTLLPNTNDGDSPIFSPDGRWIAFSQDGELRKISVLGGPPMTIVKAPVLRGSSWGPDDTIVYAPTRRSGIWRVSANGGEAEQITTLDPKEERASHRWPFFMPDGKSILYTATANEDSYVNADIVAMSLADKQPNKVISGGFCPMYIASGHLLFVRGEVLMAVAFDPQTLTVTGPETPVVDKLATLASMGIGQFSVSDTGLLLSLGRTSTLRSETLVWLDTKGNEEQASKHVRDIDGQALSPDGKHIAVSIADENGLSDIWVIERERDMLTRLTVDQSNDIGPLWSHDQQWIYFSSDREKGTFAIFRRQADGTGSPERLTDAQYAQFTNSLSLDGTALLFTEFNGINASLHELHLTGDERGKVEPFLVSQFANAACAISPDGKWIAYVSNITGTREVYVQQFPGGGHRIKISSGRGSRPRWMPDGSSIVYRVVNRDGDPETDDYYSVAISQTDGSIRPSPPELLFTLDPEVYSNDYDIAADGERFLFLRTMGVADSATQPTLVTNWFTELKELVPAP